MIGDCFKYFVFLGMMIFWNIAFIGWNIYLIVSKSDFIIFNTFCGAMHVLSLIFCMAWLDEVICDNPNRK